MFIAYFVIIIDSYLLHPVDFSGDLTNSCAYASVASSVTLYIVVKRRHPIPGIERSELIEHGFTSAPTQYRLYGRRFLADRTNGRAIATLLRLLSVVCDVMYCG